MDKVQTCAPTYNDDYVCHNATLIYTATGILYTFKKLFSVLLQTSVGESTQYLRDDT